VVRRTRIAGVLNVRWSEVLAEADNGARGRRSGSGRGRRSGPGRPAHAAGPRPGVLPWPARAAGACSLISSQALSVPWARQTGPIVATLRPVKSALLHAIVVPPSGGRNAWPTRAGGGRRGSPRGSGDRSHQPSFITPGLHVAGTANPRARDRRDDCRGRPGCRQGVASLQVYLR